MVPLMRSSSHSRGTVEDVSLSAAADGGCHHTERAPGDYAFCDRMTGRNHRGSLNLSVAPHVEPLCDN
jgi:hypothetical protein